MFTQSAAFYKSSEWGRLRAECKRLAGYRCRDCGWRAPKGERRQLHAHHRVSRPDLPFKTALDVQSNLVCLCDDCHRRLHPHMGRRVRSTGTNKAPKNAVPKLFRAKSSGSRRYR